MQPMTGALEDLNDLYFFAAVVEHGGFSAAGRALGLPKSRLSKRVAQLEERLGVRLLQRTTRKFVVTDTGQRFYRHCRAVLEEARAAQDAIDELQSEPRGIVRISSPVLLSQSILAPLLPEFMQRYPRVQIQLLTSDRRVDVIDEGYDIALRVRFKLDTDASLIVRQFGVSCQILVASPAFLQGQAELQQPADLAHVPALTGQTGHHPMSWELVDASGTAAVVEVQPVLVSGEFVVLHEAACRDRGVALLPESVCAKALAEGRLQRVLPGWSGPLGIMHFVYPSRRGLVPGVRAMVDFLAERLPGSVNHALTGKA